MSDTATTLRTSGISLEASLSSSLDLLSRSWRAHCLLESAAGRVVAHSVHAGPIAEPVVEAVVRRTVQDLANGRARLSTAGLLPGGPVVVAGHPELPGPVVTVPVVAREPTWLWVLLPPGELPTLTELNSAAEMISSALQNDVRNPDEEAVEAALQDLAALPARLVPPEGLLHVVSSSSAGHPDGLLAALRSLAELELPPVRLGQRVYLLVPPGPDVASHVEGLLRRSELAAGDRPSAMISDPATAADYLSRHREQADLALSLCGRPGRAGLAADHRSSVTLSFLSRALEDLPFVGQDPVERLRKGEAGRDFVLARSLLAWLDAHGDVSVAAARSGVHPNTLRYRIGRARDVLGTRMDDPDERLEVHLRLRKLLSR